MFKVKTLRATCKALDDDASSGEGTFEALVSTYGVDSVGDRVVPGAFGKSLADWQASGDPIPVVWSHQHADPFSHIGAVQQAEEREGEGLYVKGQLDVADNPTAAQVYRLLKSGRVRNFSFAYDVLGASDPDAEGVTDLTDLKLYEVGPTLIGANQETRTLAVKSGLASAYAEADQAAMFEALVKTGRVLSSKNESDLRQAMELIRGVLAQLDDAPSGESSAQPQGAKTSGTSAGKAEDPSGGKAEDPRPSPSVDALAVALSIAEREDPSWV